MRGLWLWGALLLAGCSPVALLNASAPFGDMQAVTGIAYGPSPRQRLDVYRPTGTGAAAPVVVFFYGGNWRTGDRVSYRFVASALTRLGAVVVIPDYRLFPETAFPGFVEDAAAATAWAVAHASDHGGDPQRIFLAGHSAGAHIALLLALDQRFLAAAGVERRRILGAIGLAGPYDFLPADYPDTAPVFAATADPGQTQPITFASAAAPPLLLATGDADTTVMPRNTRALAARIDAVGGQVREVVYPGIGHAGIIMALTPLFRGRAPLVDDIARFLAMPAPG